MGGARVGEFHRGRTPRRLLQRLVPGRARVGAPAPPASAAAPESSIRAVAVGATAVRDRLQRCQATSCRLRSDGCRRTLHVLHPVEHARRPVEHAMSIIPLPPQSKDSAAMCSFAVNPWPPARSTWCVMPMYIFSGRLVEIEWCSICGREGAPHERQARKWSWYKDPAYRRPGARKAAGFDPRARRADHSVARE
jgi:hypothetical protein